MVLVKEVNGKKVLELHRKEKYWVCSECGKEYKDAPTQCSCGAVDKVFTEKDVPLKESSRKLYIVVENFIYDINQINKDSIVSMIEKDRVTKGLLGRNLLKEMPEEPKKEGK